MARPRAASLKTPTRKANPNPNSKAWISGASTGPSMPTMRKGLTLPTPGSKATSMPKDPPTLIRSSRGVGRAFYEKMGLELAPDPLPKDPSKLLAALSAMGWPKAVLNSRCQPRIEVWPDPEAES